MIMQCYFCGGHALIWRTKVVGGGQELDGDFLCSLSFHRGFDSGGIFKMMHLLYLRYEECLAAGDMYFARAKLCGRVM